jgi:hypothetical protein
MTKKFVYRDKPMTDIKRLKEIDTKLQKQKDILWNSFVLSKFKDETIRQELMKINDKIVQVQIPLIEHEIRERDSKTVKSKEDYHEESA